MLESCSSRSLATLHTLSFCPHSSHQPQRLRRSSPPLGERHPPPPLPLAPLLHLDLPVVHLSRPQPHEPLPLVRKPRLDARRARVAERRLERRGCELQRGAAPLQVRGLGVRRSGRLRTAARAGGREERGCRCRGVELAERAGEEGRRVSGGGGTVVPGGRKTRDEEGGCRAKWVSAS